MVTTSEFINCSSTHTFHLLCHPPKFRGFAIAPVYLIQPTEFLEAQIHQVAKNQIKKRNFQFLVPNDTLARHVRICGLLNNAAVLFIPGPLFCN
jgi:hypothetical protein